MSHDPCIPDPPALVLPTGPFWSSCGPADGPIRERHDLPGCIGMHPADPVDAGVPSADKTLCGIAYAVGYMADARGSIGVYRLTFGKTDLPGRWTCVGRRFVELGEAAEFVGGGPVKRADGLVRLGARPLSTLPGRPGVAASGAPCETPYAILEASRSVSSLTTSLPMAARLTSSDRRSASSALLR
jgi:hypothetical protein